MDAMSTQVLNVLLGHKSRERSISRGELLATLRGRGMEISDRHMRECIKQLRRAGYLICSAPEADGGYYMAASLDEFFEFDRVEFAAKIADMSETRRAMQKKAREVFGDAVQVSLF